MATEIVKSTAITNLDAVPPVRATAGVGAVYSPQKVHAFVTVATGITVSASSYYRMVRVPRTAKIKRILMWLDAAATTITGDVGIYYSDNPNLDGTPSPNNAGGIINADHFASGVALAAIVLVPLDVTREATTYLGADMELPLWNTAASGLTADPGGFIDIVFTPTATTSTAAVLNMEVEYAE